MCFVGIHMDNLCQAVSKLRSAVLFVIVAIMLLWLLLIIQRDCLT